MLPWTLYFATRPPPNAYFYLSSLSFWEQISIKKSCCFFSHFFIIFQRWWPNVTICGPLRNPVRLKMAPQIGQVAPENYVFVVPRGVPGLDLLPESIPIDFWWILANCLWIGGRFWSMLNRSFAILIELLMDLLMFWDILFGPMFANVFLYSTNKKQGSHKICQDLPRSVKIKQDQPKDR